MLTKSVQRENGNLQELKLIKSDNLFYKNIKYLFLEVNGFNLYLKKEDRRIPYSKIERKREQAKSSEEQNQ